MVAAANSWKHEPCCSCHVKSSSCTRWKTSQKSRALSNTYLIRQQLHCASTALMSPAPSSTHDLRLGAHPLRAPQVIVAHGDVVLAPGGKAALERGSLAFFAEVADRRRRQQEAASGWPSRATILAAAGAASTAVVVAAYVRRRHGCQPTQAI